MKKISIIILISVLVSLIACGQEITNVPISDIETTASYSDFHKVIISADWSYYNTADEICNKATNIYTGKITDISFDIIDMKTGKSDASKNSASTSRMLYTVYTISISKTYKGDNTVEVKLACEGGLTGYNEEKQNEVMESSGLIQKYNGIPVFEKSASLAVGKEYLFCTESFDSDFEYMINPTQFAFDTDSESAKNIINACK